MAKFASARESVPAAATDEVDDEGAVFEVDEEDVAVDIDEDDAAAVPVAETDVTDSGSVTDNNKDDDEGVVVEVEITVVFVVSFSSKLLKEK